MKKGKDGYYHSKVVPAPGVKPIYFRAKTLREFNEKRQAIIDEYVSGEKHRDMAFTDMVKEWWDVVRSPRIRSAATRAAYQSSVKHIMDCFPKSQLARAVRYSDLQRCLDSLAGYTYNAAEQVKRCLIDACDYAVAEGMMQANPARSLQLPKIKAFKKRTALDAVTARSLREKLSGHPDELLFSLLYYTGMRRSEAAALMWQDVDFESQRINLSRAACFEEEEDARYERMKTPAAVRTIPILEPLLPLLLANRGLPNTFVIPNRFGAPLGKGAIDRRWAKMMYDAGYGDESIYQDRYKVYSTTITMHMMRHHFATACYMAELDPGVTMRLLGHASYSTTMTVYTDLDNAMDSTDLRDDHLSGHLRKVAEKLHYRRRMTL